MAILNKFWGTFETYWNSPEFEEYSSLPEQCLKLARALRRENSGAPEPDSLSNFRIRPFPYQQEILDRLAVERSLRGHFICQVRVLVEVRSLEQLDHKRNQLAA